LDATTLNIPALLARIPLFNGLAEPEIGRIAKGTREMAVPRGEILFHPGDPCQGIFLVVYGQVKLSVVSPQGSEKVVEIIGQGQTFGEAVMFLEKPYPVLAQTLADSTLLHISRQVIFDELERDPALGRKMLAGLSMRLHRFVADVESYSLHTGRERVIGYLLQKAPPATGNETTVTLSVSKGIIASRLNLTQEHFSRILHDLSSRELIKVEGRRIQIPDVEQLRHFEG